MTQKNDRKPWRTLAEKELRGKALDELVTVSPDGLRIQPLVERDLYDMATGFFL